MEITLHKNAKTTPAIRKEIQESKLSISQLATKFGIQKNNSAQMEALHYHN